MARKEIEKKMKDRGTEGKKEKKEQRKGEPEG